MTREASSDAMRRIGLSLKSCRAKGGVTADELAEAIGVTIRTNPHREQDGQHHGWQVVPLVYPGSDTLTLTAAAMQALCQIWRDGYNRSTVQRATRCPSRLC